MSRTKGKGKGAVVGRTRLIHVCRVRARLAACWCPGFCWWDSLVSRKTRRNINPFIPEEKEDEMRWTLWGGMDHTSDFGCSICLLSPRPSDKPKRYTLRRASWGATEPCVPSRWQTWQGPAGLLATVIRPSITRSTLRPSSRSRALTVWHLGSSSTAGLALHGPTCQPVGWRPDL